MNLLIKSQKNGGIDWPAGPPVGEDLDLALVIGLPGYQGLCPWQSVDHHLLFLFNDLGFLCWMILSRLFLFVCLFLVGRFLDFGYLFFQDLCSVS